MTEQRDALRSHPIPGGWGLEAFVPQLEGMPLPEGEAFALSLRAGIGKQAVREAVDSFSLSSLEASSRKLLQLFAPLENNNGDKSETLWDQVRRTQGPAARKNDPLSQDNFLLVGRYALETLTKSSTEIRYKGKGTPVGEGLSKQASKKLEAFDLYLAKRFDPTIDRQIPKKVKLALTAATMAVLSACGGGAPVNPNSTPTFVPPTETPAAISEIIARLSGQEANSSFDAFRGLTLGANNARMEGPVIFESQGAGILNLRPEFPDGTIATNLVYGPGVAKLVDASGNESALLVLVEKSKAPTGVETTTPFILQFDQNATDAYKGDNENSAYAVYSLYTVDSKDPSVLVASSVKLVAEMAEEEVVGFSLTGLVVAGKPTELSLVASVQSAADLLPTEMPPTEFADAVVADAVAGHLVVFIPPTATPRATAVPTEVLATATSLPPTEVPVVGWDTDTKLPVLYEENTIISTTEEGDALLLFTYNEKEYTYVIERPEHAISRSGEAVSGHVVVQLSEYKQQLKATYVDENDEVLGWYDVDANTWLNRFEELARRDEFAPLEIPLAENGLGFTNYDKSGAEEATEYSINFIGRPLRIYTEQLWNPEERNYATLLWTAVSYDDQGHYVDVLVETSVRGVAGHAGVPQQIMITKNQDDYDGPDIVSSEVYSLDTIIDALNRASYVQVQYSQFVQYGLSDGKQVDMMFTGSTNTRAMYLQYRYEPAQRGFVKTLISGHLEDEELAALNNGLLSRTAPVAENIQLGQTSFWIFEP